MKRVTAFVGSARKQATWHATRRFLDELQALGGVECELVRLSEHRIGVCKGCKVCFVRGEEHCPLDDDRDALLAKMMASDGVVIATPNYSFQLSGMTKLLLDRLGFVFHRPAFFGKTFTSIVSQGVFGGDGIARYLDFVGKGLGFNTVKGAVFTTLEPMTERERREVDDAIAAASRRFHRRLMHPELPVPSLVRLFAFRASRTSMRLELDERSRDFQHYRKMGWFESDYYYPVRLGALKKAAGALFDWLQARLTQRRHGVAGPPGSAHRRAEAS